ncbi:2-hydroxyacid dehydrogenase [Daejeonella oryzae]|uniref:2-hydroxyacid dehydrogenase n=1 Tax=Daejeonella oryzae TaxID=1122943 RepID=UPI000406AD25|nr:2-hydroxyacid dehydrogenase [Daejeonella oryzae]
MKVAVFSTKSYDQEYLEKMNADFGHEITYFDTPLNPLTTDLAIGFDAVCVFVNDKIDQETLRKLAKDQVKIVALRCAGYNNVDLKTALENNIKVVHVPSYSPEAVAEHALALILTLNRKTHKAYNRVREGNFSLDNLIGFNLHNKAVGVIGTGEIGSAFCKIMMGFGCRVLAHDIHQSEKLIDSGVEYTSLEELFSGSDIISLHCPLNTDTHHLINKQAFSLMKKGVMIINTGRGALIHTPDVIHALKSKKIGYLGLDVYEQEAELFFNDLSESVIEDELILRLLSFPNVLITSHQGFLTKEALSQIALTTLENLSDFENDLPLKNEVKTR